MYELTRATGEIAALGISLLSDMWSNQGYTHCVFVCLFFGSNSTAHHFQVSWHFGFILIISELQKDVYTWWELSGIQTPHYTKYGGVSAQSQATKEEMIRQREIKMETSWWVCNRSRAAHRLSLAGEDASWSHSVLLSSSLFPCLSAYGCWYGWSVDLASWCGGKFDGDPIYF